MTPDELVSLTVKTVSLQDNSDFKEVMHRGEYRKTKVQYGDTHKAESDLLDGKQLVDSIQFLDMHTPFVTRGDDITFEDVVYSVNHSIPVLPGVYKVFATRSTRFASSRPVR